MLRQSKNSGHVGFSYQALRPRCKLLLYFYGSCNNYSICFCILPLVYFQLCFVPFVVYILCVISYLQLTPGCISNKSNAECVFDYYVRADKQHKFWLVEEVFSQMRSNCVTDHRPQAVFSISENNRIGFPAFRGAAARQNEWKWLLATFATFSEKCKSIQRVTNFSVVSEQKQVRMSRTLDGITKESLEKTSF